MLLYQTIALAVIYASFGTSVGKSFGSWEEKGVTIITQLYVPIYGTIQDLDISLDLEHTSFCDLSIVVTSPSGKSATISMYDEDTFVKNKQCAGWITLDNESTITIDLVQSLGIGAFKPTGLHPISKFYSAQSGGTWKIKVADVVYADTGTLNSIRFDMAIIPESSYSVISIPEPSTFFFLIAAAINLFKTKH